MQNPLTALPMLSPAVPQGTFTRGFVKGAGSGALMMGIFSTLTIVAFATGILPLTAGATLVGTALHMIPTIGIGTMATGLFSGFTASQRAAESAQSANLVSHSANREPVRKPEMAVAPQMEQAAHNSRAWTDRVSADRPAGHSRAAQIIADRSLSDGDRAAAILREREQSSTLEAQR